VNATFYTIDVMVINQLCREYSKQLDLLCFGAEVLASKRTSNEGVPEHWLKRLPWRSRHRCDHVGFILPSPYYTSNTH
jgi:hypothetical protein